jgi:hypothetical protein
MKLIPHVFLSSLLGLCSYSPVIVADTILYTLKSTCTVDGAALPCEIVVKDSPDYTIYTTRVGNQEKTVQLGDRPSLIGQIWNPETKSWQPLQTMSVDVANKLICYDQSFCMYNPNFISSLQENRPGFRQAQQQIRARFDATGRVNAICFDQGCDQPI